MQFRKAPRQRKTFGSFKDDVEENIYETIDFPSSEDCSKVAPFESSSLNLDTNDDYRMINSSQEQILQDDEDFYNEGGSFNKLVFCFSCLFD